MGRGQVRHQDQLHGHLQRTGAAVRGRGGSGHVQNRAQHIEIQGRVLRTEPECVGAAVWVGVRSGHGDEKSRTAVYPPVAGGAAVGELHGSVVRGCGDQAAAQDTGGGIGPDRVDGRVLPRLYGFRWVGDSGLQGREGTSQLSYCDFKAKQSAISWVSNSGKIILYIQLRLTFGKNERLNQLLNVSNSAIEQSTFQ